MFKKNFLIRFTFFLTAVLVIMIYIHFTGSDNKEFLEEFHKLDFKGSISSFNDTGRGSISIELDNSEIIDLVYFLNYSKCPLHTNDSISKDSNSLVIKVYRNNELIYTENNAYYEKKLK
jgi:hypothetical protein